MIKRIISLMLAAVLAITLLSFPASGASIEKTETVTGRFYCTFANNDFDSNIKTLRGVAADNTWGMQFPIINEIIEKKVSFDTVKSVSVTVKADNTSPCDKGVSPKIELRWNTRDNDNGMVTSEFKDGVATVAGILPSGTSRIVLNPYAFSASAGEITFDVTIDITYEEPIVEPKSGNIGYPNATDIKWELSEDGTLTFTGKGNMRPLNNGMWFFSDMNVRKIVIEEGITSIGSYVFQGCHSVRSVSIPSTVTLIGMNAFDMCWELSSVKMGEGVTKINSNAFRCCNKLEEIELPQTLTSIGNNCFDRCIALTEINIPGNVISIGVSAFSQCESLKKVTIGENVSIIGNEAFDGCKSLTGIILPESVKKVGEYSFRNCTKLEKMTVVSSTTEFERGAVLGCDKLTIYGLGDSTAQNLAELYSNKFVLIELVQGDINGDGRIDDFDLDLIYKHITGISKLSGGSYNRANLDSSDAVDIRDYNLLYKRIKS